MARQRHAPEPEPPVGPPMSEQERRELDERLARMVTKPNRGGMGTGFFLLWMERDDSGSAQIMTWHPETEAEVRAANAFHDAAHGIGAFAKPVLPGKPVRRSAEHAALIKGILADRDDDTGYLAYADYLTEHGDPLGDFIRVWHEVSRLPADAPEAAALNARMNELDAAHVESWYAPLGELGLRPMFYGSFAPWAWRSIRHGVIDKVCIDRPGVLPENANRLFAAAPFLRRLEYEKGHLDPAGLAKVKQLSQIEELELAHVDLTGDGLRTLLRAKHLTGLKVLNVAGNELGEVGATALADGPGLAKLDALDVSGCQLGAAGFVRLVASENLTNLKRLRIGRNAPDPSALAALFRTKNLVRLVELELGGTDIDAENARLFGAAGFAPTLTHLDLDSATFQPGAFAAFARCDLPALRSLRLNNVGMLSDAAAFGGAPVTATLEELYLDNCDLGPSLGHMFGGAHFPKLTALDLSRNNLGRNGASALVRLARKLPVLTNLRLWDNRLNGPAVTELAGSKLLANLTDLDLSGNKIAQTGAIALAGSKYLTKLRTLVVDESAVGAKGKRALLARFGAGAVSFR